MKVKQCPIKNKNIRYLILFILGLVLAFFIFGKKMPQKSTDSQKLQEHKQVGEIPLVRDDEDIKTDGELGWKVQSDIPYYNGKYAGGNAYYTADIQLSDFATRKAEEDIKKFIDKKLDEFAKDASTDNDPDSEFFQQWDMELNVQHTTSEKIDSYLLESYEYTGGAHGNHFYKSFNYNKKTGGLLTLDDILSSKDSLKELSKIADEYFSKKDFSYEKEGASPEEGNWQIWYADGDKIVFVFPPYAVAAYAAGEQRLPILVNKHKEIFKEEYR